MTSSQSVDPGMSRIQDHEAQTSFWVVNTSLRFSFIVQHTCSKSTGSFRLSFGLNKNVFQFFLAHWIVLTEHRIFKYQTLKYNYWECHFIGSNKHKKRPNFREVLQRPNFREILSGPKPHCLEDPRKKLESKPRFPKSSKASCTSCVSTLFLCHHSTSLCFYETLRVTTVSLCIIWAYLSITIITVPLWVILHHFTCLLLQHSNSEKQCYIFLDSSENLIKSLGLAFPEKHSMCFTKFWMTVQAETENRYTESAEMGPKDHPGGRSLNTDLRPTCPTQDWNAGPHGNFCRT